VTIFPSTATPDALGDNCRKASAPSIDPWEIRDEAERDNEAAKMTKSRILLR
jgi:hypothetical protein